MGETTVNPGDVVLGKYRVERELGKGAMGVVVAATHLGLGQTVALKMMLGGKAAPPEQQARFLREAQASVRLRSQHVARVLDVGALEDGAPYIVMEFLDGRDLGSILEQRRQLPFFEAVEYVLQACEAVAEAHGAGIVHRDLKPANLFLTTGVDGSPCVKVIDFGVSKLAGASLALTAEARALGSPLYMSPEQMNSSKDVDPRSDIWALGVILYELVAGRTPFHAEDMKQLCGRIFMGQPTPLAEHRADAPPGIEAIIFQCLEKDPARRFGNAAELAAALAPYATTRAAVYSERVAKVLGIGVAPSRATDLLPSEPITLPSKTVATPAPSYPLGPAAAAETMLSPQGAAPAHTSSPAIAVYASSPGVALGASSPDVAGRPSPPSRGPMIALIGALAALAIGGPVAVYLALRAPSGAPAAAGSTVVPARSVDVPAPPAAPASVPVEVASAPLPAPPTATASATAAPATPPAHAPAAAPVVAPAKRQKTPDPYGRRN